MEFPAGIFLELHAERRHNVKCGMNPREFLQHRYHAPIILERVKPRPGQDVPAGLRVPILRLVHMPQQHEIHAIHRDSLSRVSCGAVLHSRLASCASSTAISFVKFFVTHSSDLPYSRSSSSCHSWFA